MYRCYNLICETEEKLVELLRKYFYYSDFHNNELSEEEKKEKRRENLNLKIIFALSILLSQKKKSRIY